MIVIVEGIDRVGKTTLVNKLSKELHIPIFKHNSDAGVKYSEMNNTEETDKMLQMIQLLKLTNGSIIFDRFHLSDYVYGCLERRYSQGSASGNLSKIEKALLDYASKCGGVIEILVRPADIERSSKEHGKNLMMYAVDMDYAFSEVTATRHKMKLVCDYNSIDELVNEVKEIGDDF